MATTCVGILTTTMEQSVRTWRGWVHIKIVEERGLHPTKGWRRFTRKRTQETISHRQARPKLIVKEHWSGK